MDLTCPYCGHFQEEPAQVISSFCRACGEHFRVRKGIAFANPGLRVSGIAEVRPPQRRGSALNELEAPNPPGDTAPMGDSWRVSADESDSRARALLPATGTESAEDQGISAGAFFGLADPDEADARMETERSGHAIGRRAESREVLGRGSFAALIDVRKPLVVAGKEKMPPNYAAPEDRRRRDDGVPEIPVRCFRCYHIQDVSRFAKSTQCERCSAYISLASYEIKTVKSHTLRTRGDIVIAKKGGLINDSEIACHHLTVIGQIDATVDCSGDATFRHSGTVRGRLYCDKLVVEKNCEVHFPDGVMTNRAEIAGHLIGNLTCSGNVRIARTGLVEGDLAAINLELKEGGRVSGATRLDPDTITALPLRKGFNPTLIG